MTWRTVHCSDPEMADVDPTTWPDTYDPTDERTRPERPWTCNGPGPTRREFVNDSGNRDVITVEQCSRCDGKGGSHRGYTLITLEDQGVVAA